MDKPTRDQIRMAISGQKEEPVTLETTSSEPSQVEETPMPDTDDVDAGQVIDHLSRQVANLVKENAVLSVLAQARAHRIGHLEQAVRDA